MHDPGLFFKLARFDHYAGDDKLLQPNRSAAGLGSNRKDMLSAGTSTMSDDWVSESGSNRSLALEIDDAAGEDSAIRDGSPDTAVLG